MVDRFRRLVYLTAVSLLIFPLIVSSVLPLNFTFSSQITEEEQFPQAIIASSSIETTLHLLNLKAIQRGDAEPERESGFSLDTTNAIPAHINSRIHVFVTDSSLGVMGAKVRTVSGQVI